MVSSLSLYCVLTTFFSYVLLSFYLQLSNSLILVIILLMFGVLGLFLVIYINIIVLFKYY